MVPFPEESTETFTHKRVWFPPQLRKLQSQDSFSNQYTNRRNHSDGQASVLCCREDMWAQGE